MSPQCSTDQRSTETVHNLICLGRTLFDTLLTALLIASKHAYRRWRECYRAYAIAISESPLPQYFFIQLHQDSNFSQGMELYSCNFQPESPGALSWWATPSVHAKLKQKAAMEKRTKGVSCKVTQAAGICSSVGVILAACPYICSVCFCNISLHFWYFMWHIHKISQCSLQSSYEVIYVICCIHSSTQVISHKMSIWNICSRL